MNCEDAHRSMVHRVTGNPEGERELERHLVACEACRALESSYREIWRALDAWRPGREALPARRLRERIVVAATAALVFVATALGGPGRLRPSPGRDPQREEASREDLQRWRTRVGRAFEPAAPTSESYDETRQGEGR